MTTNIDGQLLNRSTGVDRIASKQKTSGQEFRMTRKETRRSSIQRRHHATSDNRLDDRRPQPNINGQTVNSSSDSEGLALTSNRLDSIQRLTTTS